MYVVKCDETITGVVIASVPKAVRTAAIVSFTSRASNESPDPRGRKT